MTGSAINPVRLANSTNPTTMSGDVAKHKKTFRTILLAFLSSVLLSSFDSAFLVMIQHSIPVELQIYVCLLILIHCTENLQSRNRKIAYSAT
jgi:hypothetical protein